MNATDISLDERIRTFADSVREHLDDLPADEVDDIVIGLSADLAEQAADADGVLELEDPATYAAELRSAAGLPERSDAAKREPLRERVSRRLGYLADGVHRSAFGAWLLDLLVALRPVWWVLRGLGMFAVVAVLFGFINTGHGGWFVPENFVEWVVLFALLLVSVQWGRDKWLPQNALRHVRTVVSVIAVIMLPVALGSFLSPRVEYVESGGYQQPGLLLDGVQVGNIFAYDENGELINSVQLYTDKGTPLNLYGAGVEDVPDDGWFGYVEDEDGRVRVPFNDARGSEVWNIFPFQEGRIDLSTGKLRASTIKDAAAPFLRAPGLVTPAPDPTPSPTPTPTPSPTP